MQKRKLWPFLAVIAFLVLAGGGLALGWGLAGEPEAKSSPAAPSPSVHPDPEGKRACAMLADARVYGATGDHTLVANVILAAKASTNKDIGFTAILLEQRLAIAIAATGKPDQREADRNLEANMVEMERLCERAGL